MTILLTGVAGFIGSHVARALLERGESVVGIDNLNPYYDPRLKEARIETLRGLRGFHFHRVDLAERGALAAVAKEHPSIDRIVHLAAQAGVRHSLVDPHAYVAANIAGHLEVLETGRHIKAERGGLRHLVFASSSSVYGGNTKLPFAVEDPVDTPQSLYAATKKADELMSYSYSHLFRLPVTGLRFFTVYGPWGRPDMAAWIFLKAIFEGKPIKLFNHGDMRRDFTFIDDVVAGVLGCLDRPPEDEGKGEPPCRIYNIGNNRSEELKHFLAVLEAAAGRNAVVELASMQPGDVPATYADIAATTKDFGFRPKTSIEEGLPRFVEWYRAYHKL